MGTKNNHLPAVGASTAASDTTAAGFVTVPRLALQALAEWAHFPFCWDRISAKLPPRSPRWTSHTFADDVHFSLQQDRMAFLKDLFWKAEQEASRREKALDPNKDLGGTPSLEMFMACVAEMDDHHWDEPLSAKALAERRKEVRAKLAKKAAESESAANWQREINNPSPESIADTMTRLGDIALFGIEENLSSENPKVKVKAQEEITRLMAGLQELQVPTGKDDLVEELVYA